MTEVEDVQSRSNEQQVDDGRQNDVAIKGANDHQKDGDKPRKKRKRLSRAQRRKAKILEALKNQDQRDMPDRRVVLRESPNMFIFYSSQSLFKDEAEFNEWKSYLKTPLPASFRINTFDYEQAKLISQLVRQQFDEFIKKNELNEKKVDTEEEEETKSAANDTTEEGYVMSQSLPTLDELEWYPKKMAWQLNVTRIDLRKSATLQKLHRFIMAETDNGFVSRQESVSMIPPLVLDVQRGHNILDMCAAPGSKTAQLIEYLKFDIHGEDTQYRKPPSTLDDGLVVANDVDNKRCYMLVHQASRLNSPNCVIVNEDASRLPNFKMNQDSDGQCTDLKFDRILCDAPCTGDGTTRKNLDVWKKWSTANANNFHGLQAKILRRGTELLKENGLIVYSTCSMNPVEDEAVVAAILRMGQGTLVLEDCSQKLKGLKYRSGVSNWTVMNRDMEIVANADEVKPEQASQIYKTLFPPSEDEAKQFHLDRCIRIYPHLQNTGAFFVAVIRKLSAELPFERRRLTDNESNVKETVPNKLDVQGPRFKKRRYTGYKEVPFVFLNSTDSDWNTIKEFYQLNEKFPVDQLAHRCVSGKKGSIYLVSKQTRNFILANQEKEKCQDFTKVINAGMRLFAKAETDAKFRICQDGVHEILPYISDNIKVPISRDDLVSLLTKRTILFDDLSARDILANRIRVGTCILIYRHTNNSTMVETGDLKNGNDKLIGVEMPLVAWRGELSVALYVSDKYKVHLRSLVQMRIPDEIVVEKRQQQQQQQQQPVVVAVDGEADVKNKE